MAKVVRTTRVVRVPVRVVTTRTVRVTTRITRK